MPIDDKVLYDNFYKMYKFDRENNGEISSKLAKLGYVKYLAAAGFAYHAYTMGKGYKSKEVISRREFFGRALRKAPLLGIEAALAIHYHEVENIFLAMHKKIPDMN